jgi:hypothetical protein
MRIPKYWFEASLEELSNNLDTYADLFAADLQSFFFVMPKGDDFLSFARFREAYLALAESTESFATLTTANIEAAVRRDALAFVVIRTILGLSPPELAYIARTTTGATIDQSVARRLDKRARQGQPLFGSIRPETEVQVRALIGAAVSALTGERVRQAVNTLHRLDKVDTRDGITSIREAATHGVAYEELLYERYLGRPFATHRDAVSEKVGDVLEDAIARHLQERGIAFHKTAVAERFGDMDQAPDFLIPDSMCPKVVVEAKVAEDDGTARDKVTRVQHLAELRDARVRQGAAGFELIACVDGRGFGVRREDIKKLLAATHGKVFALCHVDQIVNCSSLRLLQPK